MALKPTFTTKKTGGGKLSPIFTTKVYKDPIQPIQNDISVKGNLGEALKPSNLWNATKKLGGQVYNAIGGMLLPGATPEELRTPSLLKDTALGIPKASWQVAKQVATHPLQSTGEMILGATRGVSDSVTEMIINNFVKPEERDMTRTEIQKVLDKYIIPVEGDLTKGYQIAGSAAPILYGGGKGSEVFGKLGALGGFLGVGQISLPRESDIEARATQAITDLTILGLFHGLTKGAEKAKAKAKTYIKDGIKESYKIQVKNQTPNEVKIPVKGKLKPEFTTKAVETKPDLLAEARKYKSAEEFSKDIKTRVENITKEWKKSPDLIHQEEQYGRLIKELNKPVNKDITEISQKLLKKYDNGDGTVTIFRGYNPDVSTPELAKTGWSIDLYTPAEFAARSNGEVVAYRVPIKDVAFYESKAWTKGIPTRAEREIILKRTDNLESTMKSIDLSEYGEKIDELGYLPEKALKETEKYFSDIANKIKKPESLKDIWTQATKPDLLSEARKFAEAGKDKYYFVRNVENKGGYIKGKPSTEGTGRFNQKYEPTGEYMNIISKRGYDSALPNLKKGIIEFKNPLVIKTDNSPLWKKQLSEKYNGLKRDELSQAIKNDGYDGIITMAKSGSGKYYPSEVVDLKSLTQATKGVEIKAIPKELEPLAVEARKYNTADDFISELPAKGEMKKLGENAKNYPLTKSIYQYEKLSGKSFDKLSKTEITDVYNQANKIIPSEATKGVEKVAPKTAPKKVSGVAKGIEAKAIEEKLTKGYTDLTEVEAKTFKAEAKKVSELINTDIDKARAIVRGEEPTDIRAGAIIEGMQLYAKTHPKLAGEIYQELANSPLMATISEGASETSFARMIERDSAVVQLAKVKKAYEAKVRNLKEKKLNQADKLKKEINSELTRGEGLSLDKFLDNITC